MNKLTVTKAGTIEMREDCIALRDWTFGNESGERATEYDITLAVREYVVGRLTRARGLPPMVLLDELEPPVPMQLEIDAEREAGVWLAWCMGNS